MLKNGGGGKVLWVGVKNFVWLARLMSWCMYLVRETGGKGAGHNLERMT